MKRKIQNLLFVFAITMLIYSCKDDDGDKLKNAYTYGSEKKDIKSAVWEDNTDGQAEGGGYSFWLYPTVESASAEDEPNEYIEMDIPNEMMGEKFTLTEEQLYNWGWWIVYEVKDKEIYLEGFGDAGQMENVVSGTMLVKKTGDNSFSFDIEVKFDNEKTLTIKYSGELTPHSDGGGRVVRASSPNR